MFPIKSERAHSLFLSSSLDLLSFYATGLRAWTWTRDGRSVIFYVCIPKTKRVSRGSLCPEPKGMHVYSRWGHIRTYAWGNYGFSSLERMLLSLRSLAQLLLLLLLLLLLNCSSYFSSTYSLVWNRFGERMWRKWEESGDPEPDRMAPDPADRILVPNRFFILPFQ